MSELRDALVQKLEDENDVLRARVAALEELLVREAEPIPIEWSLTETEARLFRALLGREQLTKDQIMAALYRDLGRDEPELKIVDVFICKLRAKLRPFGIQIGTIWGQGYYLNPEVRARFRKKAGASNAA